MKKINFSIYINAPKQKVYDTLIDPQLYKVWVDVSWPNSFYDGKWEEGEILRFISPGNGGTAANVAELQKGEYILLVHKAVLNPDLTKDITSDAAREWIGSKESYRFNETGGGTTLLVELHCTPVWVTMFEEGYPPALAKLKEICEA
ncbi:SRPBCC family protein [Flavihumibacter sp. UBA7668]|uniref:SRPBCC family protein n=1 Tax=Flavihumibacter sp. UBA7668 TaxID=1946542 RepID=UPI0025C1F9E2|nr:SRPBCC domain-containing protein [Flavihumibacter sp. UBA7668]